MKIFDSPEKSRRSVIIRGFITFLAVSYFVAVIILGLPRHPPEVQTFGNMAIYANYGGVGHERVIIAFLFVVTAASSWITNGIFRKVTMIGFALIVVEYILWAIGSAQMYSMIETGTPKDPYYLKRGTFWDASVFVVTAMLFLFSVPYAFGKKKEGSA